MATEKYIGQKCVSCNETLNKDDDVVICPTCGSPYHRECYKKEGECINTHLHQSGEEWVPQATVADGFTPFIRQVAHSPEFQEGASVNNGADDGVASYQEEYSKHYCSACGSEVSDNDAFCSKCGTKVNNGTASKNVCPACQLENRPGDVFCARCGTPLDMEKATNHGAFFGSPFAGFQRVTPESDIDGNTVEEYSNYVGNKFFSFIPKFLKFAKQGSKLSVNLWAFIFPHFYFFYRKMNGIGIASLIITIILSVPSVFEYLATANLISSAILEDNTFITIAMACYIISMIFKFACSVFADWLYYNKAKTDIEKIKKQTNGHDLRKSLIIKKGGTSWVGVLVASTVIVIVNIAIMIAVAALATVL